MDQDGTIIYHPQQQLIFAGLKEEKTGLLRDISDGSVEEDGVIYTVHREAENGWRIVAVSYVDEVISEGLMNCLYLLLALLIAGVTFCYVQFNPVAEPVHLRVLGGIGLLQLAVSLRGWKRLTGSVFVPYTVFLGAAMSSPSGSRCSTCSGP